MEPAVEIAEGPYVVEAASANSRLSDFVIKNFKTLISANGARKAVKRGRVRINGQVCANTGRLLKTGESVDLLAAPALAPLEKIEIDFDIVYEDIDFAAVVKPAGIESRGHRIRTLEHAAFFKLAPWNSPPRKNTNAPSDLPESPSLLAAPTVVHRLDYETTGLVLIAKSERALPGLSQLFQQRKIQKSYQAIVQGLTSEAGELTTSIDGLECHSHFKRINQVRSLQSNWLSHLELSPTTGRRHQLRKQLSEIGHPIVGDSKYSENGKFLRGKGLFLAATQLDFQHPFSGERVNISAPLPHKFLSLLEREARRWTQFQSEDSLRK